MLGAGLIHSLDKLSGGRVRVAGVGGDRMADAGLASLFPISEMAVMGVFEILPYARKAFQRIKQTIADIEKRQPVAVVSIDSKAFSFRVQKRLHKLRGKAGNEAPLLIHMVAPTVWAWRPGRAKVISRFLDHLLLLYPFEPPYFERHGLATSFVGHPSVEQPQGDGAAFRAHHDILADANVLCVLPGSRPGEVGRLMPAFTETVRRLIDRDPALVILVPTVSVVAEQVREGVAQWPGRVLVSEDHTEKFDAFAASDVALAASGTVTLELTLARVPTVVAYKVSALSAPIGRLLVDLESVVITNRILGRRVMPQFLQEGCTPDYLTDAVIRLLADEAARAEQMAAVDEVRAALRSEEGSPSDAAARSILKLCGLDPIGQDGA